MSEQRQLERLRWQCRRGLLELDCIFQDYLEKGYPQASAAERELFQQLLNEQDPDLQAWILFDAELPEHYRSLIERLRG